MADPLSITAGVFALLQVSIKATILLNQFRDEVSVVDATLSGLIHDVEGFQQVLESMKETFEQDDVKANLQMTGHVGSHWKNLARSLNDGQGTLEKLLAVLEGVNRTTKFLDGPRKQLRYKSAVEQIGVFRDQIQSYRSGMQLSLSTVILWNQVTFQKSTDKIPEKILPNLDKLYDEFRSLGQALNTKIEKLENMVSDQNDRHELTSMNNLRETVRAAADVVSTASTTLTVDNSDNATIKYGSDFGDIFDAGSNITMMRWINSNTVYEYEGMEAPIPGQSESSTRDIPTEYQSDSDSDLENEMIQALLKNGIRRKEQGDLTGAERHFRNCLSRLPSHTSSLSLSTSSVNTVSKAEVLELLAQTYMLSKMYEKAKSTMMEKLLVTERQVGKKDKRFLWDTMKLAEILMANTDYMEAHLQARRSLRGFKKLGKPGFRGYEQCLELLMAICKREEKLDEEEAYAALLGSHLTKLSSSSQGFQEEDISPQDGDEPQNYTPIIDQDLEIDHYEQLLSRINKLSMGLNGGESPADPGRPPSRIEETHNSMMVHTPEAVEQESIKGKPCEGDTSGSLQQSPPIMISPAPSEPVRLAPSPPFPPSQGTLLQPSTSDSRLPTLESPAILIQQSKDESGPLSENPRRPTRIKMDNVQRFRDSHSSSTSTLPEGGTRRSPLLTSLSEAHKNVATPSIADDQLSIQSSTGDIISQYSWPAKSSTEISNPSPSDTPARHSNERQPEASFAESFHTDIYGRIRHHSERMPNLTEADALQINRPGWQLEKTQSKSSYPEDQVHLKDTIGEEARAICPECKVDLSDISDHLALRHVMRCPRKPALVSDPEDMGKEARQQITNSINVESPDFQRINYAVNADHELRNQQGVTYPVNVESPEFQRINYPVNANHEVPDQQRALLPVNVHQELPQPQAAADSSPTVLKSRPLSAGWTCCKCRSTHVSFQKTCDRCGHDRDRSCRYQTWRTTRPALPKELGPINIKIRTEGQVTRRVLVVGDRGCGKTSLIETYYSHKTPPCAYEVDGSMVHSKTLEIDGISVHFETSEMTWYTGQNFIVETNSNLSKYREAHVMLVCFNVEDPSSFMDIMEIMLKLRQLSSRQFVNVCKILVGCKSDLINRKELISGGYELEGGRKVSFGDAEIMKGKINALAYFLTSSTTNVGITELFQYAAKATITESPPKPVKGIRRLLLRK
ncbi:hypothetical protein CC78DRAFT_569557 [Lojkania enalia]|uniref:Azaphilone pigments biosynthesis cluster protein L N-terminal domain-containing protein n=1 Tax=Lojkania enalia TaxID=147567 RepID=A0A9P4N2K8_9PLEO|nr:hypothetical protein CC78DRAFT_569557 [Didymosphaeria enalia]